MSALTVISDDALVERFTWIHRERMQGLPFINQQLCVEAVDFRALDEHRLGVLITPWFMNLVLLPTAVAGSTFPPGSKITVQLPSGPVEFTAACDDELGTYLSAVLFSSVCDIPDQSTAREIAQQVMQDVYSPARNERTISRRTLFGRGENSHA